MRDYIIKIIIEESKRLLTESGIRDINKIAKRYPMAKIYFHQDLDGVTTALAMKNYLEQHGIKVVDAEIIQYGSKEFAIKKIEGEGDIMPVLVDFAHGKPMFVIHTDHHDSQAGVEQGTSTNFKPSRSNVETISQIISPKDIFSQEDVETISMIDSADYAKHDIRPEQVIQYLFKIDRTKGFKENKKMMGLVANKLLLAFKNKPNFLRNLVMNSKPSLQSILLNIKDEMEKQGYATIEELLKNQESYIKSRKEKGLTYEDGIISQYGLGPTMKAGGYDRYTPFITFPDAEFLVTGLPMGMVQASCNPYKKERALKGIDLGEIKNEVLEKFKPELEKEKVSFATLKRVSEMDTESQSVGFTFKDFMAIYGNAPSLKMNGGPSLTKYLDKTSKNLYKSIPAEERKPFNRLSVNGYDVIMANSGGHKCITNISGINYLYTNAKFQEPENRTRNSYVELLKDIQSEFVRVLKQKIQEGKQSEEKNGSDLNLNENRIYIKKKELLTTPLKSLLKNKLSLNEQKLTLPIVIQDGYNAPKGDADALHSFESRRSDKFGGRMTSKIEKKLREVYGYGVNPDVVDITIKVDSKNYRVDWTATIDESKDGKAYVGVSKRGSAGGTSEKRALGQVEPLKKQLTKSGAQDITTIPFDGKDHFVNPSGVAIHQYFFKYTLPEKYPPLPDGKGKYLRTKDPLTVSTSGTTDQITQTPLQSSNNSSPKETSDGSGFLDFGSLYSGFKDVVLQKLGLQNKGGETKGSNVPNNNTQTQPTQTNQSNVGKTSSSDKVVSMTSGTDSDFENITKKVIANFEGGYWNPFCPKHPKSGMGISTETMFGLDRYNGNIESSPEGKEFFKIIDDEKYKAGAKSSGSGKGMTWSNMDNFCNSAGWGWNQRGGSKEEELKNLAVKIMKRSFDRNMSSYASPEVRDRVMKNKGLLVHMSYASWNGPGYFKKWAKSLKNAMAQGKSDAELLDVAINDRQASNLYHQEKVAKAIKNPDGMKTT